MLTTILDIRNRGDMPTKNEAVLYFYTRHKSGGLGPCLEATRTVVCPTITRVVHLPFNITLIPSDNLPIYEWASIAVAASRQRNTSAYTLLRTLLSKDGRASLARRDLLEESSMAAKAGVIKPRTGSVQDSWYEGTLDRLAKKWAVTTYLKDSVLEGIRDRSRGVTLWDSFIKEAKTYAEHSYFNE